MLAACLALFQACGNAPGLGDAKTLFDGDKAFALLKAQTDFGPRYPGTDAHRKMRDWLVEKAKAYTDKVALQEFAHRWSVSGKELKMINVVAEMNFGAAKTVLLMAHWDTRPTADEDPDPAKRNQPILGANDGASGVAALLELMRAFKEKQAPVNIIFLFTDGEDLGPELNEMFLGAKHFARNLPKTKIEYGILLDMVGDKDLVIGKEPNSVYYARSLVDRFYRHAASIGLSKVFPDRYQGVIADDHLALNEAGIPTMDLIDFNYPYWHTTLDTADKCSAASLSAIGTAVESFLRAETPQR